MIEAKVIADSVNDFGERITTLQLRYHRFIHGELMTHRTFCIAGDARIDFDLPSAANNGERRRYSMTVREFVSKWHDGAAEGPAPRLAGADLAALQDTAIYTAHQVAAALGHKGATNLNSACREGLVDGAEKTSAGWSATGAAWKGWRANMGTRRFSLRSRLEQMQIRQVDETTGEVLWSRVKDCVVSGVKPVLKITAGKYSTRASADHRFLTDSGWKRLADIVPGVDSVRTYRRGRGANADPFRKIDGKWVCKWSAEVRDQVAERQGGVCHLTGERLEPGFHIHHLQPRHLRPDLAFDLDNVVAVNVEAHKELHRKQGWQKGAPLLSHWTLVDAIEPDGESDTYDLEIEGAWPNFFADGIVVHNSRNAMSSRAVPIEKMIEQVRNDPAMPVHWGRNQSGMQAREELDGTDLRAARAFWEAAAESAASWAKSLSDRGAHKQIVNRVLEPFQWMHTVVTATEWSNFFALRCHPDAQPEMQALACAIHDAMVASEPRERFGRDWHLPYISDEERASIDADDLPKVSAARCARVSYLRHDGSKPDMETDLKLFDRLAGSEPIHASPLEHQARPLPGGASRNFRGWLQFREDYEMRAMT